MRTTHWPATIPRGVLAAAESKFRASMSVTPMNEDTSDRPPRLQKEPNLSHIGFQCACKLPFLPSSAIEAAVAAPVANRSMITWASGNRRRIKKIMLLLSIDTGLRFARYAQITLICWALPFHYTSVAPKFSLKPLVLDSCHRFLTRLSACFILAASECSKFQLSDHIWLHTVVRFDMGNYI